MLAAYTLPAIAAWALLGLGLGAIGVALPGLRPVALAAAGAYGGYYGVTEIAGRRGLSPPGRRWQVPQTMLIAAAPRRRVVVWGALLGPGFATRNPFAGFGLLPLAIVAMPGIGPGIALGAAIGLAHGTARAMALVRDVRDLQSPSGSRPRGRARRTAHAPGHGAENDLLAPVRRRLAARGGGDGDRRVPAFLHLMAG